MYGLHFPVSLCHCSNWASKTKIKVCYCLQSWILSARGSPAWLRPQTHPWHEPLQERTPCQSSPVRGCHAVVLPTDVQQLLPSSADYHGSDPGKVLSLPAASTFTIWSWVTAAGFSSLPVKYIPRSWGFCLHPPLLGLVY